MNLLIIKKIFNTFKVVHSILKRFMLYFFTTTATTTTTTTAPLHNPNFVLIFIIPLNSCFAFGP